MGDAQVCRLLFQPLFFLSAAADVQAQLRALCQRPGKSSEQDIVSFEAAKVRDGAEHEMRFVIFFFLFKCLLEYSTRYVGEVLPFAAVFVLQDVCEMAADGETCGGGRRCFFHRLPLVVTDQTARDGAAVFG